MSETPKNNYEPQITRKEQAKDVLFTAGVLTAMTAIGISAAAGAHALENTAGVKELAHDLANKPIEYIIDATNAQYSSNDLIGEFTIKDGGLEAPALDVIHGYLGDSVYDNNYPLFYDTLLTSAKIQAKQAIPQPGDVYSVVAKDIDPEKNDGLEYLVVKPTQILHENITDIPTPIIESSSNQ